MNDWEFWLTLALESWIDPLLWQTAFSLFLTARMLHLLLSSIDIFMPTALLILLAACLLPSYGLAAQGFLLPLILILSNFLMQELTSTLNHSYLSLVNSGAPYLLYFQLPMTWLHLRGRFQDIYSFSLRPAKGLAFKWAFLLYCFTLNIALGQQLPNNTCRITCKCPSPDVNHSPYVLAAARWTGAS